MALFVGTHIEDCCPWWLLKVSLILHLLSRGLDFTRVDSFIVSPGVWLCQLYCLVLRSLWAHHSRVFFAKVVFIFATFSLYLCTFTINCHHLSHLVQHCGEGWYAMLRRMILYSQQWSRPGVFKVSLVHKIDSYINLVVAVARDPCTSSRWIGVHRDTQHIIFCWLYMTT